MAGLSVPTSALDLREVWEEKGLTCTLPVTNITATPIDISAFLASCSCMDVDPARTVIGPGQTIDVRIRLDLTRRTDAERGLARREFVYVVNPQIAMKSAPGGWRMHGVCRSRVTLSVPYIHFGEAPVRGQTPIKRSAKAVIHVPYAKLDARVDPKIASVALTQLPESAGEFDVTVSPNPALRPGPFEADLTFWLTAPSGETLWAAVLPIEGVMQREVRLLPARVSIGLRRVGETASATVVVQAPDNQKIAVEQIDIESPDVHVEQAKVDGVPDGRAFRVVQQITTEGECSSFIRLTVRRDALAPTVVSTDVCYRGTRVPVEPSPGMKGVNP